jgi:hypothetical protein
MPRGPSRQDLPGALPKYDCRTGMGLLAFEEWSAFSCAAMLRPEPGSREMLVHCRVLLFEKGSQARKYRL